jgi:serine/threonine protein kinase
MYPLKRVQPSELFGRYKIDGPLGRGGMGDIFRAYDPVLRRWVALKVLRREVVTGDAESLRRARAQLLREARAAAVLNHPNAVAIFDVGEVGETPFLAMELLEGRSMREYIGDPRVDLRTKLAWLADVARALAAAHERGLVHRDVKPENVMVCTDGTIKVLDFGIAKITRPRGPVSVEGPPSIVTMVGNTLGTPRYMAPEIILGQEIDGRADQFAWGIVAYELLVGKHAWAAQDAPTQYGILNEAPPLPPIVSAGLPPDVAGIVTRALEKRSQDRFPSMQEVVAALDAAIQRVVAAPRPPDPMQSELLVDEKTAITHSRAEIMGDLPKTARGALDFRPGEVLDDRYELVSEAGRGPHAIVFRARDLKARTWVALKVLVHGGDERRLRRELLVARSVTHPGVVRMYDLVEVAGRPALTMELVEGQTLSASLARGERWSPAQLTSFGLEVARALGAVHAAKVVHTDLKASKILIRTEGGAAPADGHPVVTGFGSARVLDGKQDPPPSSVLAPTTVPNMDIETLPLHIAPELREQLVPVGPSADLYAFGHVWFEAAVGVLGELPAKGAARVAEARLASKRPDLDASLVAMIVRCLAPDPKDRFADGGQLRAALEARGGAAPRVSPQPVAAAPVPDPALRDTKPRLLSEPPPRAAAPPLAVAPPAGPAAVPPPGFSSAVTVATRVQKKKGKGVAVGLILAFLLAVAVGASIVLFGGGTWPAR